MMETKLSVNHKAWYIYKTLHPGVDRFAFYWFFKRGWLKKACENQAFPMDYVADLGLTWLRSSLWFFQRSPQLVWLRSSLLGLLNHSLPLCVPAWRHKHPWGRTSLHKLASRLLLL